MASIEQALGKEDVVTSMMKRKNRKAKTQGRRAPRSGVLFCLALDVKADILLFRNAYI